MESRSSGPVASQFSVSARVALTSLLLLASLVLAGCHKASRDDRIAAHDDTEFEEWVASHSAVLTPAETRELNEARQLIRFRVMQAHTGLPADEFAKAVYADIDGKTVREVLLTGNALQIGRVKAELANFQPQLKRFETHEADQSLSDEQKTYVANSLSTLHQKIQQREEELTQLKARLEELKRAAPASAK